MVDLAVKDNPVNLRPLRNQIRKFFEWVILPNGTCKSRELTRVGNNVTNHVFEICVPAGKRKWREKKEVISYVSIYLFFNHVIYFFIAWVFPLRFKERNCREGEGIHLISFSLFFSTFSNLFITLFYYLELLSVFCLNGKKDEKKEERKTKFRIQTKIKYDITQNLQQVFGSIVVFHKISRIFWMIVIIADFRLRGLVFFFLFYLF